MLQCFWLKNYKNLGTFGICGCYSFAPNKIITTGQGGLVVTNDKKIYKKIKQLKDQGRIKSRDSKSYYTYRGFNFKFTDLQASLGISQLKSLKKRMKKLIQINNFYNKNLIQNDKFKIIHFNLEKGELPLWTDIYSEKSYDLYNYLKRKKLLVGIFGIY